MLRSMMMSMGQNPSEKNSSDDAANEKPKVGFSKKRADFISRYCGKTQQRIKNVPRLLYLFQFCEYGE